MRPPVDANMPTLHRATVVQTAATSVHRLLTLATLLCIAAQFFLAGLGVFERQRHSTPDGYFGPHMLLGLGIGALTLLLAGASLLSRAGSTSPTMSCTLFVLAGPVEPLLASLGDTSSAWFGALHALTGAIIAALTGLLFTRSRQRGHGNVRDVR